MIKLNNVSKQLGDFCIHNVSIDVKDNEYFVILGPTGAGKTAVLEMISGMYKPDNGEIWLNDRDVTNECPEQRNVGFVYQDYMLFPNLDVRENINFALKLKKTPAKIIDQQLREITKMLNIEGLLNRYPATLSGGEEQRVALARALIARPQVLLLDEPLSALDPRSKELFLQELKNIHQRFNITTIHITHDFNEALALADRIGIMNKGELVEVGTTKEVFQKPSSRFVAEFVGMENIYEGEIVNTIEDTGVLIGHVYMNVVTGLKGKVHVAIRPEDIIITRERFASSARNALDGSILEILPQGSFVKLVLDVGITMVALLTKHALEEMDLGVGQTVLAVFKTSAVHIF